ncbi:MAG: hypothetical protein WA324_05750, partial [Bryobacteraceae bacterium]
MRISNRLLLGASVVLLSFSADSTFAQTPVVDQIQQNALLAARPFLHISGPNPIITRGAKGTWDEDYIEAGDILKENATYYFYYHGAPVDHQLWGPGIYRIGVASSNRPLGPWTKIGDKPLVDVGKPGTWDDGSVACPVVFREKPGKFFMWYCGVSRSSKRWGIGMATASSPAGPWTKYGNSPVIPGFGYVSSVVKKDGKYYLYAEHPIGSSADDYGPMSLATADNPEGPWTAWSGNPVLPVGETGAWDDAGYSEAKVFYRDGMFHMFYGGAKEYVPRRLTQESIGYAYSLDGEHFIKYGGNPVALRESSPNAAAFAEVHAYFEPPFVYAYHTLRYLDPKLAMKPGDIDTEDLGVEVLVTQSAFTLPVPVLVQDSLPARSATKLSECPPISLNGASEVTLVASADYETGAKAGLRVHIRSSVDGMNYDSADLLTFEDDLEPGATGQKTVALEAHGPFIKAFVENLDGSHA